MIRLLVDEDFNNDILRGLLRRVPELDAPRVQAIGLAGAGDEAVLAHAATEQRLCSHMTFQRWWVLHTVAFGQVTPCQA
jgi:hypothetical protein